MDLFFDNFILNLCIIPALIILILSFQYYLSISYWKSINVPFIPPKFPFGNVNELPGKKFGSAKWFAEIYKVARVLDKKFIGLIFFTKPVLVIVDPKVVEDILIKDADYFEDPDPKINLLGDCCKQNINNFENMMKDHQSFEYLRNFLVQNDGQFDFTKIFNINSTISSITNYCLLELSKNGIILKNLQHEIVSTLCKNNDEITLKTVAEMTYLNQVILETLRKYPPIQLIKTEPKRNYKLRSTNTTIQKGIQIWIPILGLHYDIWHYPEPQKFNPDRFQDTERIKRHPFTFIPLGKDTSNIREFQQMLLSIKVPLIIFLRLCINLNVSVTDLPMRLCRGGNRKTLQPKII